MLLPPLRLYQHICVGKRKSGSLIKKHSWYGIVTHLCKSHVSESNLYFGAFYIWWKKANVYLKLTGRTKALLVSLSHTLIRSLSLPLPLSLLAFFGFMCSPLGRLSASLGATIDRHVKTALKPVTSSPSESRASVKAIIRSSVQLISHRSHYYWYGSRLWNGMTSIGLPCL